MSLPQAISDLWSRYLDDSPLKAEVMRGDGGEVECHLFENTLINPTVVVLRWSLSSGPRVQWLGQHGANLLVARRHLMLLGHALFMGEMADVYMQAVQKERRG